MTVSEAATRLFSDAAVATREEAPSSPSSSGKKAAAVLMAMLLTLGVAGALGYTQWWIPRQEAQQTAQLKYEQCLREVKAYRHKHSYKARLAQCERIPHQLATPTT
ncbi:MAG TPA: hypothetical protein VFL10_14295 [Ornithinibacter sp.]|nr:hypothetical protein [Ornithinibacter sp.]